MLKVTQIFHGLTTTYKPCTHVFVARLNEDGCIGVYFIQSLGCECDTIDTVFIIALAYGILLISHTEFNTSSQIQFKLLFIGIFTPVRREVQRIKQAFDTPLHYT